MYSPRKDGLLWAAGKAVLLNSQLSVLLTFLQDCCEVGIGLGADV